MSIEPFDLALSSRLVFGVDTLDRLGELTASLGVERALIVTDGGIVAAGHVERAEASLRAAGLAVERFADVRENPSTEDVDACLALMRDVKPDGIVGLGGGSSLDVAKGANLLYSCGGALSDYQSSKHATDPLLPFVAVPTTAGTGTEVQSYALISDATTHQKMACGHARGTSRIAVLDPKLTVTMPASVTAVTGLDTIGHAVETAVTRRRTPASALFSHEAFRLAAESFSRVLATPDDLDARGRMLRAASFAGIAIENSMLGAAHALANPLSARFGIVHGMAVALMLPHVVRYNAEDPDNAEIYAELARDARLIESGGANHEAALLLADTLQGMAAEAGLPASITVAGVGREDLPALADEAARQWTGTFNPRPVGRDELLALYESASD